MHWASVLFPTPLARTAVRLPLSAEKLTPSSTGAYHRQAQINTLTLIPVRLSCDKIDENGAPTKAVGMPMLHRQEISRQIIHHQQEDCPDSIDAGIR